MMINGLDITKLSIEPLREIETQLVETILHYYDDLEIAIEECNDAKIDAYEFYIGRDMVKLKTVRVEIQYRFQSELLHSFAKI